jgi:radical SAM superfamily enzyme YgiQ (UPF0313 family)
MKEVLLVNPWIYDFTAYDFWLKPLGLLYVASIVRENSSCRLHFVDCLDRFHPLLRMRVRSRPDGRGHFPKEAVPTPDVLRAVPRRFSRYGIPVPLFLEELGRLPRPEVVLMTSGMTYWYPGIQLAVDLIRRKWGQVPIVLGGTYAILAPEHARRFSGADVVVEGAAENTLLPLLKNILGDSSIRERSFGSFADLPGPALDLLNRPAALPILTSRGCPFRCSFCATPLRYPAFEPRSPASVALEIEENALQRRVRNFAFYDDALLVDKEIHIEPILQKVIEKNLGVAFHTPNGIHVRQVDRRLASLFRRAGVVSIYLSQESFNEEVLAVSCPKVSSGDLARALEALEGAGYLRAAINVYLIVGLPGQELQTVRESIAEVRRLGARPRLAFFSPVPGTVEWAHVVEKGCLAADADPLLHNKLAFAYIWGRVSSREFEALRRLLEEPS